MKTIYVFTLLLLGQFAFGQINQTDAQGRKQGSWRKLFEGTDLARYEGEFVDDVPVGTFTHYHRNRRKKAVIEYRGNTGVGYATMYEWDGWKMAEGLFNDEKRDSTWRYYGPDGDLVSTIEWTDGVKNGNELIFYEDGSLAEKTEWSFGVKEGLWIRKFPDGSMHSRATYAGGKLEGEMRLFDTDGHLSWIGEYVEGLKHGTWFIFENGEQKIKETYEMGELMESECLVDDCPELAGQEEENE